MAIQDLKEGMSVNTHALVVEKKIAVAKNGKPYADLVVSDKTGKLKCKIWSYSESDTIVELGKVIMIDLNVSSYNGELQGVISSFQPSDLPVTEFVKSTRFNVREMYSDIVDTVENFTEPLTQAVAEYVLASVYSTYPRAPAATGVHNAWLGGLLEHTWSMLKLARPIILHYKTLYGANLSTDKLYFGVICHDAFKAMEYDSNNLAFPKTPDGVLVNHIVMGPAVIWEACNKWFDKGIERLDDGSLPMTGDLFLRERAHLMHLVASHHGQLDWGSPVVPSTLEAVLLHQIDMIDSRFMHALELVEGKEGKIAGFSEKSWTQGTCFMK